VAWRARSGAPPEAWVIGYARILGLVRRNESWRSVNAVEEADVEQMSAWGIRISKTRPWALGDSSCSVKNLLLALGVGKVT